MSGTYASGSVAIGICDRCQRKFPYKDLMPDGNSPGLRVCAADRDQKDPWRLPPIQPDAIILRYPRPDVSIAPDSVVQPGVFTIRTTP